MEQPNPAATTEPKDVCWPGPRQPQNELGTRRNQTSSNTATDRIEQEEPGMRLHGKRVIALVEADYEDLELWYPVLRLREEGAEVVLAGLGAPSYRGKHGLPAETDANAEDLDMADFDAILVVGGWAPDKLRRSERVLDLLRAADTAGKLIGVICHGGWVPASAGILKGRTMTCTPGIKDDATIIQWACRAA